MGLALHNYHSANDCMPAAYLPDRFGRPNDSWRMALLPYMERVNDFNQINFAVSWDAAENSTIVGTRIVNFLRPEESDSAGPPITKFLAVTGPTTPFHGPVNLKFDDLKDGLPYTIMFGEVAESDIRWAEPRDLRLDSMTFVVNGPRKKMGYGSPYGGARVGLMDGAVRTLKNGMSPAVLRALVTANGGETVEGQGPDWQLGAAKESGILER